MLSDTFVDTEPPATNMNNQNSQIIYGRRGTGKKHAQLYLAEHDRSQVQNAIYLDLRAIGSDGSIYNDQSRSLAERSVRLVLDVLRAVGNDLYGLVVEVIADAPHPDQLTIRLDDIEAAFAEVRIVEG